MTTFIDEETVLIRGTIKDENGVLVTPDDLPERARITVLDPLGVPVINDQIVSFSATGVFRCLYNLGVVTGSFGAGYNSCQYNAVQYNEGGTEESAVPALGAYHVRLISTDTSPTLESIADYEFFLVD